MPTWKAAVCYCNIWSIIFYLCARIFILFFLLFNSNQLVVRGRKDKKEKEIINKKKYGREQVSGCGHLKPCGSPDHRPFHLLSVQLCMRVFEGYEGLEMKWWCVKGKKKKKKKGEDKNKCYVHIYIGNIGRRTDQWLLEAIFLVFFYENKRERYWIADEPIG